MNFLEELEKGKKGLNKGLPLGPGFIDLNKDINGLQRNSLIAIAAASKCGKSTFVNYASVIHPYLYSIEKNIEVRWIYYSFEMDRVSMEFDFCCYFLYHDYNITKVKLDNQIYITNNFTKEKETIVPISTQLIRGKLQDDYGNIIIIPKMLEEKVKEVYEKRIIPLFGKYDNKGRRIQEGKIEFIENKNNPTGIRNDILDYARKRGEFNFEYFTTKDNVQGKRILGYTPNNPNEYVIVIVDTIRKVTHERGYNKKETVDKCIEYFTDIRRWCGYIFIPIIHLNRNIADIERKKFMKDLLHPDDSDVKDTGNLAEECTMMITMFDPNDTAYALKKHFGLELYDINGNIKYENMRTFHIIKSRDTEHPRHYRKEMQGNIKNFKPLTEK